MSMTLVACKPYDKPQLVTISPSQTAFLIPLVGNNKDNQGKFDSEAYLTSVKVASKQIQIPHRWLQEGRMDGDGKWIPTANLIIVERKPETREWTESNGTGTSSKNEGINAESKESIGFMARMNCSAQINETDAVRFLYRYNNKPLAEIIDTEIRARIESDFVEACAKYNLDQVLLNKQTIMAGVRSDVIPYFAERGITITVIGMKGEFTYLNKEIQASIDQKFKTAQDAIAQKNINDKVIAKAQADAKAIAIQAQSLEKQLQLKALENQAAAIAKWDGKMPLYGGGTGGTIFSIPVK